MRDTQESRSFGESSDTVGLLLEIGCEEIPARFLAGAEYDLGQRLTAKLRDARLLTASASAKTGSTPRRLVAYVPDVHKRQPDRIHQVLGPSVRVAFDQDGKPTRAAEAFAAKHHVHVSDLSRIQNAKGEYIAAELIEDGSKALQVLREVLPGLIGSLSFPKSMYWTAKAGPRFVRPIRWILALLGEENDVQVVPFEFAGVHSGSHTFGHRLKGALPIEVADLNLDLKLAEQGVVLHAEERRQRIQEQIKILLEGRDLAAPRDNFLEDWVVSSTEWPTALMGSFEGRYLALPREVLVTVMRGHQKYFAVEDKGGSLRPHFITVLNVPGDPKGLIRQGHERVLGARFADAEFFWKADQKISLADRIPMLDGVMYHERLGTYGNKVERMKVLAAHVCDELEARGELTGGQRMHTLRAVELCKCDLTTQMVQEFTELQGVIGGLYTRVQGEAREVAEAVYDHYRPASAEDICPQSTVGAVVSLADKLDSVVAGFSVGLEPTGSSDPFGLRRAGNGVVKLCIDALPGVDLGATVNRHAGYVARMLQGEINRGVLPSVDSFLRERMEFYFRDVLGLRYDTVRAVLAPISQQSSPPVRDTWRMPSGALKITQSLERVRNTEDFMAMAAAAKRTRNILSKSAREENIAGGTIDLSLLTESAEKDLANAYLDLKEDIKSFTASGNYEQAFRLMAGIRSQVDRFFDQVLVLTEELPVRRNRLSLLARLNEDLFTGLADLAEIAVEPRSGATSGA
jgi:glycyl-tRNA synthetase beta chain